MGDTWFKTVDLVNEDRMFIDGIHMMEEAISLYEPVGFFDDYITEAFGKSSKGETTNQIVEPSTTNQKAVETGRSGIMKVIDAILSAIKKLKESVSDFIQKRKMSDAERKAYEQFREMVKADPSLANKKVRVRDFREVQKRYAAFLNECDAEYRKVQQDANHPIEKLLNKGKDFVKNNISGVFHSVNAVGLINMAGTNRASAKFIYNTLKSDEELMEKMRKDMGDAQFKKFNKDMKQLGKLCSIKRLRMKVTHQYYDDYVSAYLGAYRSLIDLGRGHINLSDGNQIDILNNLQKNQHTGKTIRKVVGTSADIAANVAGAAAGGVKDKAVTLASRSLHKYNDDAARENKAEKRMKKRMPILSSIKKPSFEPVGGRPHMAKYDKADAVRKAEKAATKAAKKAVKKANKKAEKNK